MQPSCYFQHWTPVIHSHPLVSFLFLSVSCPLPSFMFSIIYKPLLFLFQRTLFVTVFFFLSLPLFHRGEELLLVLCLHFYPLCASLYFQSSVLPSECYAGSFATLIFSTTSFPLSLLNACFISERIFTTRDVALIVSPHTFLLIFLWKVSG